MSEKDKLNDEIGQDGLRNKKDEDFNLDLYPEMVPSAFAWMRPDALHDRVEEIDRMMNDPKNKVDDDKPDHIILE